MRYIAVISESCIEIWGHLIHGKVVQELLFSTDKPGYTKVDFMLFRDLDELCPLSVANIIQPI